LAQIVEFLVTRLRFVPCKELIAISLVLKSQQSIGCCALAAKSLSNIIKFDPIFKDVFREVGESQTIGINQPWLVSKT
jgi:hypothetical protein